MNKGRVSKRPNTSSTGTTSYGAPKGSSLKAQLRGKQRLLNKVLSATPLDQQTAEEFLKRKQALETSMISLKVQNQQNRSKEIERKNAIRYHKVKFFEQQKLSRMEHKLTRQLRIR